MTVTSKHCLSKYGDPKLEKAMTLWHVPPELIIGVIPTKIYCNKDMVVPLKQAFTNVIQRNLINELRTYDGCFNIRRKRGASSTSLHAWGIAIDINAGWNQYGKSPTMSKELVNCFVEAGFEWGGNWSKPDGMHMQLAKI
jgi:hypothetical protein